MEAAMKLICATLLVIGIFFSTLVENTREGWSGDLQKGVTAAQKGNFETALREWTPLAEQGYAKAQYNLAVMYGLGNGVIQDNVYAHMWGNIGASNGNEDGGKVQDTVAKKMTPAQIAEAQTLARECVAKNYKGC